MYFENEGALCPLRSLTFRTLISHTELVIFSLLSLITSSFSFLVVVATSAAVAAGVGSPASRLFVDRHCQR